MKSTSGSSAYWSFNDFTNWQTVDSETLYFFVAGGAPWETACFATVLASSSYFLYDALKYDKNKINYFQITLFKIRIKKNKFSFSSF